MAKTLRRKVINARSKVAKGINELADRKKPTTSKVRGLLRRVAKVVKPTPRERKNPIATARAVTAGIDLFYPGKSAAEKKRLLAKFLSITITPFPENVKPRGTPTKVACVDTLAGGRPVNIGIGAGWTRSNGASVNTNRGLRVFFKNKAMLKTKRIVLHEMSHFFFFGKNTQITGNALSGYFLRKSGEFNSKGDLNPWVRDAEEILAKGRDFEIWEREHDTEMNLGHAGTSPARIGRHLGVFAAEKEKQWNKPASGLFLIREVCGGKKAEAVIKKIESGKLDAEIEAFAKKHYENLTGEELG